MRLKLLGDRVQVKSLEEKSTMLGHIHVPHKETEEYLLGDVVAVGPGKRSKNGARYPTDVQAGDRVRFGTFAGEEVMVDGEEYLVMPEGDVQLILEGRKGET